MEKAPRKRTGWSVEKAARILVDSNLPLDQKIDQWLELVRRQVGAERASIALLERNGKRLSVRYSPQSHVVGQTIQLKSPCISAIAFNKGKPLIIKNIEDFGDIYSLGAYRTKSCISIPVQVYGKSIAVVNFADKEDDKPFMEQDMLTIQNFLESIAVFLENARLYEQLSRERKQLRRKNRDLKGLLQWKEDVVHMIVHDLKTPINEIMANLDLLTEESFSELGAECLDTAVMGCENLLRIVYNLLDISKMQAGKMVLNTRTIDLKDMVHEVMRRLAPVSNLKNIRLIDSWESSPLYVKADETIMIRALTNLLDNAIKYSPEGSVVEITAKTMENFHVVDIVDQGPGIPEEFQKNIFKSYVQGPTDEMTATGTGLGLSMSRLATLSHGGKIVLKSKMGKGSCFSLHLPVDHKT